MRELFYPQSIAVIGVSTKADNLGRNIVANQAEFGFEGTVYAVGLAGGMVEGIPIHRSVLDIPAPVELAVILTPARSVPGILEECGQKEIRWAVIETGGFREYGEEGRKLEEQLVEIAHRYGIRFIGPNCIGIISMESGLCLPFLRLRRYMRQGKVSIIAQSGGVGTSMLNLMVNEEIGLNKFVTIGNALDLSAEDVLEYLLNDPGTREIILYLESVRDGRRLTQLARRSDKPILVVKSNIGRLGKKIAASHTASLSSDDRVVDAAFRQAGMIRVRDATTLINALKCLRLPPMRGKRLAIISRSGGQAVVAADACEMAGLELAELPEPFLREIEKHFRASVIRLTNPLDLGDLFDLGVYREILERTLQLPEVDGVVFMHTPFSEAERLATRTLIERIIEMMEHHDKPVAYYTSTATEEVKYLRQTYSLPIFTTIVESVRGLANSYHYHWQRRKLHLTEQSSSPAFAPTPAPRAGGEEPPALGAGEANRAAVRELIERARAEERDLLLPEALAVLEHYGVPIAKGECATSAKGAAEAAKRVGFPAAMKVIAGQISHKTDVGGVALNLRSGRAVRQAFADMKRRLANANMQGVWVQPMVSGGHELILGGRQDPNFGPVALVGLGGVFVEVFEDVALRVAPLTRQEAREMIEQLRGAAILTGARGQPAADIAALSEMILRVSRLLLDFPEIAELDINPIRVFGEGEGCRALDARFILRAR